MNKTTKAVRDDLNNLGQDARTLLADTVRMTGEKAAEIGKPLAAALQSAKETCGNLQEKAVQGAKGADEVVRENPYEAVGIAFGVGVLVGIVAVHQLLRSR